MTSFLMIEPAFSDTYWCKQYLKGIKYEISQNSFSLCETDLSCLDQLIETADRENVRPIMLLIGTSTVWIPDMISKLGQLGIHTVTLSPFFSISMFNTSCVTMDYPQTIFTLSEYFCAHGRNKTALFGINPNSIGDMSKCAAFLEFWQLKGVGASGSVFWNNGSLADCCSNFYKHMEKFDSVLCPSDIAAIKLSSFLKERGVAIPLDICLAAFGDTVLGRMVRPGITTIVLDYVAIGRQAVKLCMMLAKNPALTSISATVAGSIRVRESTGFEQTLPTLLSFPAEIPAVKPVDFYSDKDVMDIFYLENMISHCDELDFDVLRGILSGRRYCDMAEVLHTSENTLKYRVKRMISLSHQSNRSNLIRLISKYLDLESI